MILNVYAIRDLKNGFMPSLSLDQNDDVAIRGFAYSVNAVTGIPAFAPQDYELYRLGTFDMTTGKLDIYDIPVFCASGLELVKHEK